MDPVQFDEESEAYINEIKVSAAIDIKEVEKASEADEVLQMLKQAIDDNNFEKDELKEYKFFKDQLTYTGNLLIRSNQIIVPKVLRKRFLELGHEGHPGESAMKRRLRARCWWPNLDKDVTKYVQNCQGCLLVSTPTHPEPMTRRSFPNARWIDIAIDFLGPLPTGEYLLVIIDYFSRYMEVKIMHTITAEATIAKLDWMFIRTGIPVTITLDNGRQFVSSKFKEYCDSIGSHLNHTAPYWPQANGLVERQNRTLLKRLKIGYALYGEWKTELRKYILMYNTTPHSVTDKTPTELMFGKTIRSKIPQLSDIETAPIAEEVRDRDHVLKQKGKEMNDLKRNAKKNPLKVGDEVLQRNLIKDNKLTTMYNPKKFRVIKRNGPIVTIRNEEGGEEYDRNVAHVKKIPSELLSEMVLSDEELDFEGFDDEETKELPVKKLQPERNRRVPARYQ